MLSLRCDGRLEAICKKSLNEPIGGPSTPLLHRLPCRRCAPYSDMTKEWQSVPAVENEQRWRVVSPKCMQLLSTKEKVLYFHRPGRAFSRAKWSVRPLTPHSDKELDVNHPMTQHHIHKPKQTLKMETLPRPGSISSYQSWQ